VHGLPAGVAAGHPDTAAAGLEILADGGSAADAAVAAILAACVTETVMTGLAGGGHLLHFDAAAGRAHSIDAFVTVPGLGEEPRRGAWREVDIWFASQAVPYAVGAGTCAVPGVPAACDHLWRRWGRLPWSRLVEPALALAAGSVLLPPAHAAVLEMLSPVLTLGRGGEVYAATGRLARGGERVRIPGLARLLAVLQAEGAATFYRGTVAEALLDLMRERDGRITRADLDAYTVLEGNPSSVRFAGRDVLARRDHSDLLGTLTRLPTGPATTAERVVALADVLAGRDRLSGTTALVVADRAGNVCAAVTSLGLGTGDWLPGYDLHLNSMLGEVDLIRPEDMAGERLASNMTPTLVMDDAGVELAAGAAGGTRIRSALVQALVGVLVDGRPPAEAVAAPRLHPLVRSAPARTLVHCEPGFDEASLGALEAVGYEVVRWEARHHYFGGANVIGRAGAAGDPRRDGAGLLLDAT
jgi:gamma-glutamyltranspeptidase / glutathione hydrolase